MNQHHIQIDNEKCIGCGMCKNDCPQNNINIVDKKACTISDECLMCGHCSAICPKAAISITGYDQAPEEIDGKTILDSGELLQAIKTRRSIRKFTNKEVSQEQIQQIIEAGKFTPTGKNTQDVKYIVLQNKKDEAEKIAVQLFKKLLPIASIFMADARNRKIEDNFFFKDAPIAIVVYCKSKTNGLLAASNMSLMAEALGLGVLYSGFFTTAISHSNKLKRMLSLKGSDKVAMTLVIGHTNLKYKRTVQRETPIVRYI